MNTVYSISRGRRFESGLAYYYVDVSKRKAPPPNADPGRFSRRLTHPLNAFEHLCTFLGDEFVLQEGSSNCIPLEVSLAARQVMATGDSCWIELAPDGQRINKYSVGYDEGEG